MAYKRYRISIIPIDSFWNTFKINHSIGHNVNDEYKYETIDRIHINS